MIGAEPPLYEYSHITEDEIRLLLLDLEGPEGRQSQLKGTIETFYLPVDDFEYGTNSPRRVSSPTQQRSPEVPEYDAVSYTWGDNGSTPSTEQYLHIFDDEHSSLSESVASSTHGQSKYMGSMKLSRNLEQALRTFRSEMTVKEKQIHLWVDSICIRQDESQQGNHYEKSTQIGKMSDIYVEAEQVRVWLGCTDEEPVDVHTFIKKVLTLDKFDEMVRNPENVRHWNALKNLVQSPWFERRWIVQEIAYARKATVYWGSNVIPWYELVSTIQLFYSERDTLRRTFQKSPNLYYNPDVIGEFDGYAANILVRIVERMLRKSEDGDVLELLFPIETVVTAMAAFNVSKPHDTVYAILQLCNDAQPASDRSILQVTGDETPTPRQASQDIATVPSVKILATEKTNHMYESPDRLGGIHRSCVKDDTTILNSTESWADSNMRGRTQERNGHLKTLLTVQTDHLPRSRSRGRSPGAAKSRAERQYRRRRQKFRVNYSKSVISLCTEVIAHVVEASKSLDIICKPWAPDKISQNQETLSHPDDSDPYPSWIQPRSHRAFSVREIANNRSSVRVGADNLAGSHVGPKTYSASGILPAEHPYGKPLIDGRILHAQGFIVDRIDKISAPAINATIPSKWLSIGWRDRRAGAVESMPPEQFWRTLVANRESSNGTTGPPSYWRQACHWAYSRNPTNANLDLNELIHSLANTGAVSRPVIQFLQRVRAVVWDRALILTKGSDSEAGSLGLVPQDAQIGDFICILRGCSVPVVLRPKTRSSDPERTPSKGTGSRKRRRTAQNNISSRASSVSTIEDYAISNGTPCSLDTKVNELSLLDPDQEYSLIGECYIHGLMDGEVFSRREDAFPSEYEKERTFKIGCTPECKCRLCSPPRMDSVVEED